MERKADLDTEIKASGCFNQTTSEQMAEFDRLNQAYLEKVTGDHPETESDEENGEVDGDVEETEAE